MLTELEINQLQFSKIDGLLPVIIQNNDSGQVLMLGYMNIDALLKTLNEKRVTFYSRSKERLWTKGESSGNYLELVDIAYDCDNDALLALVNPKGPTCHTGSNSCFGNISANISFLSELESVIKTRKNAPKESSYTAHLYHEGIKRIAQKVGEEGVETALAAVVKDKEELSNESADLLYHLIVLLQASDMDLNDVINVLKNRHSEKN